MRIEHYQLKKAVFYLGNELHKEYPQNRYRLSHAYWAPKLWTLEIGTILPKGITMDYQPLPPPQVTFEELEQHKENIPENSIIDAQHIFEAIEKADTFVKTMEHLNLSIVWPSRITGVSDHLLIIYYAIRNERDFVAIDLKVPDEGVVILREVRIREGRKKD